MRRFSGKAGIAAIAVSSGLVAVAGFTGAQAAGLIDGGDIKNGSVTSADIQNGSLRVADLRDQAVEGLRGQKGAKGNTGAKGAKGDTGEQGIQGASGLTGAYYSVAYYDVGDTNAGAIATVACKNQTDVAISGGVQVLGIEDGANARNTPVSSSFPGRMDFSLANPAPKPNRLDGWIVQFGGSNDNPPKKTKIWALCVPGADIPVEQTYLQSE